MPDSFPTPVGMAAWPTGVDVVPLACPEVAAVVLLCCDSARLAEIFVRFKILFSNHPRLLHVTVQSGSLPVTNRKIWSALVVRVVVVPLADRVRTPLSSPIDSSSALPAFDTSDVVPLELLLELSCRSGRACPAFWRALEMAPFVAKDAAVAVMKRSTPFSGLRSDAARRFASRLR